jgi:peptidoglycan/xylan/chitin deacetylase (PgdA/CDA1 family)
MKQQGHLVGSHSYSHCVFTRMHPEGMVKDLQDSRKALRKVGVDPGTWFRLGQATRAASGRWRYPAGLWLAIGRRHNYEDRLRGGSARSHRCQLGHPTDQPPPGDVGFDRGSRPRRSGRADGRWIRKRPSRVAVCARSRRAGIADFHIWTNRGDPDTPPQGAQRRAVHALEATAQHGQPKLAELDHVSPTTVLEFSLSARGKAQSAS